ncbi:hypothetical protein N658DRAFT_329594 [Parathielavia hyrcaniae]|uniref:Uncharacterized protein n=1 Tax=Parathielavia hyrcaniae TaxID=113614 RepID=A0AAN6Q3I5_9PEZI|nr:hypothetical protein N658DRAFT_329594 [Parathielavia hyrcaniae]
MVHWQFMQLAAGSLTGFVDATSKDRAWVDDALHPGTTNATNATLWLHYYPRPRRPEGWAPCFEILSRTALPLDLYLPFLMEGRHALGPEGRYFCGQPHSSHKRHLSMPRPRVSEGRGCAPGPSTTTAINKLRQAKHQSTSRPTVNEGWDDLFVLPPSRRTLLHEPLVQSRDTCKGPQPT